MGERGGAVGPNRQQKVHGSQWKGREEEVDEVQEEDLLQQIEY